MFENYVPGSLSLVERNRYQRSPSERDSLKALAQQRIALFEQDKWPDLVIICRSCGSSFQAQRSTSKYCTDKCRLRVFRNPGTHTP